MGWLGDPWLLKQSYSRGGYNSWRSFECDEYPWKPTEEWDKRNDDNFICLLHWIGKWRNFSWGQTEFFFINLHQDKWYFRDPDRRSDSTSIFFFFTIFFLARFRPEHNGITVWRPPRDSIKPPEHRYKIPRRSVNVFLFHYFFLCLFVWITYSHRWQLIDVETAELVVG